jgi:hypothetical protein
MGKEIKLFLEDVAVCSYMCIFNFRTKAILLESFLNNIKIGNVIFM